MFIDNDATVAALAEAHDEQLRLVARDLVMLTVGTGVGGGLVLAGSTVARPVARASSVTRSSASRSETGGSRADGVPAAGIARVARRRPRA